MRFMKFRVARVIVGHGAIEQISEARKFGRKALIVTGKNVSRQSFFRKAVDRLDVELDVEYEVWNGVRPEPDVEVVEEGVEIAKAFRPDFFIAIGGGSVIDAAKLVNLCWSDEKELVDYIPPPLGKGIRASNLEPLIAIPTTFGTGSETTCAAVVKLSEFGIKAGIIQEGMLPKLAIVDGSIKAPKHVAASAGMDALMHAIEAYTCRKSGEVKTYFYSGSNPLTDALAEKAIELIANNFIPSLNDDSNARMNMAMASYMAGIAFGNAGVHVPHAASHAIAGLVSAPHGVCVASVAPALLEFLEDAEEAKLRRISEIFGCSASEGVRRMMETARIPTLSKLGVGKDEIKALVEGTMKMKRLLVLCPKPVEEKELEEIFERSLTY